MHFHAQMTILLSKRAGQTMQKAKKRPMQFLNYIVKLFNPAQPLIAPFVLVLYPVRQKGNVRNFFHELISESIIKANKSALTYKIPENH
jgi:hypothetical protein